MSEDSVDTYELLTQAEAELAAQIRAALANDGKKAVRVPPCGSCGATQPPIEVEMFSAEEKVKALSATSQARDRMRKSQKDEATSAEVTKLLRDRSELSDADLAEYISRLEKELAEDG